jgi:hypothetical protein
LKKISLRAFGLLGTILFVPLFVFTFLEPHIIEKSAKSFIHWKLQIIVNDRIDSIQLPKSEKTGKLFVKLRKKLNSKANEKLVELKEKLKFFSPMLVANKVKEMSDVHCKCREKFSRVISSFVNLQILKLKNVKTKLAGFTQAKYMEIVNKLTLDVRIFLGANSLVFTFLLLTSFLKLKTTEYLFLPALLMLVSTIICSYFYVLEQNWFYTILFNDYTGFSYIVYLSIVFASLCDISFNEAKITSRILGFFGNAFSGLSC